MNLMDEPIFYTRHKASPDELLPGKELCLDQKFGFALVNDDKDEYMRLAKQVESEKLRGHFNHMFMNDALEIFKAFETLIDVKDLLKDGMTPLHLAVLYSAPRLTKYFLDSGSKVDAVCFISKFNIKLDVTPLDLSLHVICIGNTGRNPNLWDLLWWICFHNRQIMEIIRMFVRSAQGETWARKAFVDYAREGELHKSAALFLAVPELFLSPPQKELCLLRRVNIYTLNAWENSAFIREHLSLLIDIFTFVGLKLAAYIRLKEYDFDYFGKGRHLRLEIDYFLREVADKKMRKNGSSRDYYLRFFYAADGSRLYSIDDDDEDWDTCTSTMVGTNVFFHVSYLLSRKDFERNAIYSLIPRLEKQDADRLSSAIEKKLSSLEGEAIQSVSINE
ncbi:uncharacterized protein LOC141656635 isoform X2 [Silene latifolia]|uniref:uncharacterized protein LOC141656635 isoform X2 n=1 Tax=Silene latifolia TaxID=37657 RepID=UPI003D77C250